MRGCQNKQFSKGNNSPRWFFSSEDDPVWTLRGVQIKTFAIVAPDAFGLDDSLPADCTPLTCLFTNLTGATFRPAFNPKDRQLRQ